MPAKKQDDTHDTPEVEASVVESAPVEQAGSAYREQRTRLTGAALTSAVKRFLKDGTLDEGQVIHIEGGRYVVETRD